jgi:hypothetical protein
MNIEQRTEDMRKQIDLFSEKYKRFLDNNLISILKCDLKIMYHIGYRDAIDRAVEISNEVYGGAEK